MAAKQPIPTTALELTMKSLLKPIITMAALALQAALPAWADDGHGQHKPAVAATVAASDMTDAEVRKIDMDGGKVTLKHAEIKSLDMPGLTMVFVVKDKALRSGLKAGDKVKFKAINEAGEFTVTALLPAP